MEQTEFQDRMSDLKARSMWLVTDSAEMANVTAYLDENNKVVMFYAKTKGDVYMALDGYRFFDTEKEALEWHEKLILNLRDKMKQCRELIEELDGLHSNKHFSFKKEDYLGMYGKEKSDHYCEEMRTFMDACHILSLAVGPKVLNINGQTIPLSEVVSVNWHNGHNATLILKNGSVSTHRYAEYVALEFIYGNNNSGRVMVNANQSDDEKKNLMEQKINFDELVQMKQDGKIGWLDFVLKGDDAEEYKQWCQDHGEEPTEDNAELFVEMTDERVKMMLVTM